MNYTRVNKAYKVVVKWRPMGQMWHSSKNIWPLNKAELSTFIFTSRVFFCQICINIRSSNSVVPYLLMARMTFVAGYSPKGNRFICQIYS